MGGEEVMEEEEVSGEEVMEGEEVSGEGGKWEGKR